MTIDEASKNINNPNLITAIKSAIVCTNTKDTYSAGFRNGLRYVIALLSDEEPKYEDAPKREVKTGHWIYESQFADCWSNTCSECGKRFTNAIDSFAPYCWNCGAKMQGGEVG